MEIIGGEAAKKTRKARKKAEKEQSRSRFCKGGFKYDPKSKSCVKVEKPFKKVAEAQKKEIASREKREEKERKEREIPMRKRVVVPRF